MTLNQADLSAYADRKLVTGIILSFRTPALGSCEFNNYYYQYDIGGLNGQWVRVKPVGVLVQSQAIHGTPYFLLPGGRVFSPWSEAGERAPTTPPIHTQRIRYTGNVSPVQIEISKLQRFVGVTANLYFSFGRYPDGNYSYKACQAMLLPFAEMAEYMWDEDNDHSLTTIIITAQWQQLGEFWIP
jgi:hypothetical protein